MNQELDWGNLSFGYIPTDYNVRCYFRDGKWGEIEVSQSEEISLHIAATCLHYGQEIFEGLKAFRGKDGKVRVFRLEENARRIQESAKGILMEPLPLEKFKEMVLKVVKLNERFVPPYGFRRITLHPPDRARHFGPGRCQAVYRISFHYSRYSGRSLLQDRIQAD